MSCRWNSITCRSDITLQGHPIILGATPFSVAMSLTLAIRKRLLFPSSLNNISSFAGALLFWPRNQKKSKDDLREEEEEAFWLWENFVCCASMQPISGSAAKYNSSWRREWAKVSLDLSWNCFSWVSFDVSERNKITKWRYVRWERGLTAMSNQNIHNVLSVQHNTHPEIVESAEILCPYRRIYYNS